MSERTRMTPFERALSEQAATMRATLRTVEAERDRLREALADIAEPMARIRAEAEATGCRIDGFMAKELCKDAHWLRSKARAALAPAGQTTKET